jgi:hypothetical protein
VRLARPERVVVDKSIEHLAKLVDRAALGRRGGQLLERSRAQVLELKAIVPAALLGRRG